MLKVLLAGDWSWDIYEAALTAGLEQQGARVIPIPTRIEAGLIGKLQARMSIGPAIWQVNHELVVTTIRERPEVLFLHRPRFVQGRTLRLLKGYLPRLTIVTYNNDNPFDDGRRLLWWRYFDCVRSADINFLYRPSNVAAAERRGIPRPRLLKPYYVEGLHRPGDCGQPRYDVTFVGHYEPDGRLEFCEHLLDRGIPLMIFGTRWEESPRASPVWQQAIRPVRNEEYATTLAKSKISLAFCSGQNRDVYTRRCFEIPACGSMMLAPRTADLQQLYEEGREADYFGNKEELLRKVTHYLTHEEHRRAVAAAGRGRCLRDGHSNVDRAGQILREVNTFLHQQSGTRG